MSQVSVLEADLDRTDHQSDVVALVDAFAIDRTGKPLPAQARCDLIPGLQGHPTTHVFLAYHGDSAIGVAVCFLGFSTFAARPLINIHDLLVLPQHRGQGVGRQLLQTIERRAREMGCCKLTLEVQEDNHRARQVYEAAGFKQPEYQGTATKLLSLSKALGEDLEIPFRS
jgi:GNAT superfamily N-acetyltransferase